MPFVLFSNSEVGTGRNGLIRAGQKFWKGPVGLVGTQEFRKHKHLFLATLRATTNAVVSHYDF